jgi:hypothetical protein
MSGEVCVEQPARLVLGTGEQVPVSVIGDRDGGVPHEGGERLGVAAGSMCLSKNRLLAPEPVWLVGLLSAVTGYGYIVSVS